MPHLKFTAANVNIACDGNSLSVGWGGYTPYPDLLAQLAPLNGAISVANTGIAGQTTRQMNGLDGSSSADIDSKWVAGKTNILIVWEGTNSISNAWAPVAQALQDMVDYIAARQAVHPWRVVLLTCLPRQSNAGNNYTVLQSTRMDEYNQYLRANYRNMGAHALVDIRAPGSPFNIANYDDATFEALANSTGMWAGGETGNHIHLNNAGYAVVAKMVADALKRLPAR